MPKTLMISFLRSRRTKDEGRRTNSLCSLSYSQPSIALPLPFSGDVFSALGDDWILFKGEYNYRLGWVSGKLEVPAESPFASLSLGQPMLTLYGDDMRFVAGAPKVVGKKATAFSYG